MVSPEYPDDQSHSTDINDGGYAIVNFYNKLFAGSSYSYIWKDGVAIPGDVGYGLRINNQNQMTGYYGTAGSSQGVVWDGTTYIRLEELEGTQDWNRPHALNDAGDIYGYSLGEFESPDGWQRAVGWTKTGQLFEMGMSAMGSWGNLPQAVNNSNQVVGYADGRNTSVDTSRAWLWQNGVVELLPTRPNAVAPRSWAFGINNRGQVVGAYFEETEAGTVGGAALWENGKLSILAPPTGAEYGTAYDINEAGYAVGLAEVGRPFFWTAVLWDAAGNAYSLDDLVENLGDLKLERALAINNRNQIVGIANDPQGSQYGFLLHPVVPEPSTAAMGVATIIAGLLLRRRGH
jgi:uncharacterized membrane protein